MFIGFLQDLSDIVLIYTSGLVHLEADGTDPNRSQMALSAASAQLLPAGEVFKWTVGRWRS